MVRLAADTFLVIFGSAACFLVKICFKIMLKFNIKLENGLNCSLIRIIRRMRTNNYTY